MSNAVLAKLHYNLLIMHSHKLAEHITECQVCKPGKQCDKRLYLVGEWEAAKLLYKDTTDRWLTPINEGPLAKESLISEIPECPHHCPE
jgi:hypothetical protein